jgi:hypothetical protein
MKNFCCNSFQFFYSSEKNYGLNIRVIKLTSEYINRAQLKYDIIFYITEGYPDNIDSCEKKTVIDYCPFCGINLRKKYGKSDEFVQEIMDI